MGQQYTHPNTVTALIMILTGRYSKITAQLFIYTNKATTKQNNNKSIEIYILEANFSICWI